MIATTLIFVACLVFLIVRFFCFGVMVSLVFGCRLATYFRWAGVVVRRGRSFGICTGSGFSIRILCLCVVLVSLVIFFVWSWSSFWIRTRWILSSVI